MTNNDSLDEKAKSILLEMHAGIQNKPNKGDVGIFSLYVGRSISQTGISFGETEWNEDKDQRPLVIDDYASGIQIGPDNKTGQGNKFHCWTPVVPGKTEPVLNGEYVAIKSNLIMLSNSAGETIPQELISEIGERNNIEFIFSNREGINHKTSNEAIADFTKGWPGSEEKMKNLLGMELYRDTAKYFEIFNRHEMPSPGAIGKCVLYFNREESKIGMAFKSASYVEFLLPGPENYNPGSIRPELRQYMGCLEDYTDVGYHRSIDVPRGSKKISGGSFYVEPDGTFFIDRKSGDFGPMHVALIEACFEEGCKKFEVLDNQYICIDDTMEYLGHRISTSQMPTDMVDFIQKHYAGDGDVPF